MSSLLSHSVWAPDAIPAEEWKYRNLTRVVFPGIDIILALASFGAFFFGIPAVSEFYPKIVTTMLASLLTFAGIISFFGVGFPKLWRLEIMGKVVLFGILVIYFFSILILAIKGDGNRVFVLGFVAGLLVPIVWRLSVLGAEWQKRRLDDPNTNRHKGE